MRVNGVSGRLPAPLDRVRLVSDAVGELARVYFEEIPDVFRRPNTRLYDWLGERIASRGVRGVLFWRHLFCDLWHAELDTMRRWSPVPVLDIDVAEGDRPCDRSHPRQTGSVPRDAAMMEPPQRITLDEWDLRYGDLRRAGLREPAYGGCLRRHVDDGDKRLLKLRMDNSAAALRLWNFLLTEEDRLHQSLQAGKQLVGTLKDLGTVPVMAYAMPDVIAFYPDGAWWIPCIMQQTAGLLEIADSLGIDDSFCPVSRHVGRLRQPHALPDSGAADLQRRGDVRRLVGHRTASRQARSPGVLVGDPAPSCAAARRRRRVVAGRISGTRFPGCVRPERTLTCTGETRIHTGRRLTEEALRDGIQRANHVRRLLAQLRQAVFYRSTVPTAGAGNADRRDVGDPFLFGSE